MGAAVHSPLPSLRASGPKARNGTNGGKSAPVPDRLVSFAERARLVAECYSPSTAMAELQELLGWLNSRRLREEFVSDSSALVVLRKFFKTACASEDLGVAEACAEAAELLLRDKGARTIVWRTLLPEEMALWLMRSGSRTAAPTSSASHCVALRLLWRLAEHCEARSALQKLAPSLQAVLLTTCRSHAEDALVQKEACLVIRAFSEQGSLRPIIHADLSCFATVAAVAAEMATKAPSDSQRSGMPELATVALAALATLMTLLHLRDALGAEAIAHCRHVAKTALEVHTANAAIQKWANAVLLNCSSPEELRSTNTPAEKTPSGAITSEPIEFGKDLFAPMRLETIANLELLSTEAPTRVRELWLERFREASPNVIAGVMSRTEFDIFQARSSSCPTFLIPVQRESGLLNLICHVQGSRVLYQSVEALKGGAAGAGTGRADLVLTLFPDLLESHDLVLLHGQLCSDLVDKRQAAEMVRFTRCAYTQQRWRTWVEKFNLAPATFDVEAYLAEFVQPP